MLLETGKKAPAFTLYDQKGKKQALKDYAGSWVLIYFYPKDFTPGCTKEACAFRDVYGDLKKKKVKVIGVSRDSVELHKKFAKEHKLPFTVLSDDKGKMSEKYGALITKKVGKTEKQSMQRISYLLNPAGKIVKVYGRVMPLKHADQVLKDVTKMQDEIKAEELAKKQKEKEKAAKKKSGAKKASPAKKKSAQKPAKKAPAKKSAKPAPKKSATKKPTQKKPKTKKINVIHVDSVAEQVKEVDVIFEENQTSE